MNRKNYNFDQLSLFDDFKKIFPEELTQIIMIKHPSY